ncbi:Uncharacterized protein Adt_49187 [Abeliophyllum distichum]|uniref:Uncharacterized protein n=1 Tax=Abeliophyllum distichum TaxID=126358 RepID=A0ABD1NNY4_9LAMI
MRKSFASVLQSAPDSACHQFVAKEPFLHHGEPALTITADEEASLAEPFKFTLVGKFSHRKPSMVEEFLFALSKLVGVPLRIDEATTDLLRPSEARVCVEVNLEHKLPDRVWIERGLGCPLWMLRKLFRLLSQLVPPASKPIFVPKPTVDPAPKPDVVELPVTNEAPLVDRIGKGKGKEVVVEPRKQWVPLASSSSIPPPVIPILPSEVHKRPISEHSSPVTTDMASKPVIADTVFDPLLDHMMSLPREYPVLSEPVQPVFDPVPHTHPDPSCHENVEASIPSDTASSIQLGDTSRGIFVIILLRTWLD